MNIYIKIQPVSTLDTVHTPLTIESKSGLKLSFHEANLIDYASTTLVNNTGTQLKTDLVPWADGVKVRVKDTFTSSWRTLQIGEKCRRFNRFLFDSKSKRA